LLLAIVALVAQRSKLTKPAKQKDIKEIKCLLLPEQVSKHFLISLQLSGGCFWGKIEDFPPKNTPCLIVTCFQMAKGDYPNSADALMG
jgi:hypothetical protein